MTNAPTHDELTRAFPTRAVSGQAVPEGRTAAVAMVFRIDAGDLQLCLGRRASVAGDPWSGDLAFPGGKADPGDATLHDVAARESFEEVGLQLARDDLVGDLGHVPAHGGQHPLATYPLVYLLRRQPTPFSLNHEFSDAQWVRLTDLWDAGNWVRFVYPPNGQEYSAVRTMEHVLWGYSLRVLHDFSIRLQRPLTALMQDRALPLRDGRPVAGAHR